jgi:hypothetical protein
LNHRDTNLVSMSALTIMRSLTVGGWYLSEMALYDKVDRRAQQSQPVQGPTVPLVADRRNLHTDPGVPSVSRRQAVAAKAELASFRDSYLPIVKLRK